MAMPKRRAPRGARASHEGHRSRLLRAVALGLALASARLAQGCPAPLSAAAQQDEEPNAAAAAAESVPLPPLLLDTRLPDAGVAMRRADGRSTRCTASASPAAAELARERQRAAPQAAGSEARAGVNSAELSDKELIGLVAEALRGLCVTHDGGWWKTTYCAGSEVFQVHDDPPRGPGTRYSLGGFASSRVVRTDERQGEAVFLAEKFEGGQPCDETKAARVTEARLYCCDATPGAQEALGPARLVLFAFEETAICKYTVTACSPALCRAGFAPPAESRRKLGGLGLVRALAGSCFEDRARTVSYCPGRTVVEFAPDRSAVFFPSFGSSPAAARARAVGAMESHNGAQLDRLLAALQGGKDERTPGEVRQYFAGSVPCAAGEGGSGEAEGAPRRGGGKVATVVRLACFLTRQRPNEIIHYYAPSPCLRVLIFHLRDACELDGFADALEPQRSARWTSRLGEGEPPVPIMGAAPLGSRLTPPPPARPGAAAKGAPVLVSCA